MLVRNEYRVSEVHYFFRPRSQMLVFYCVGVEGSATHDVLITHQAKERAPFVCSRYTTTTRNMRIADIHKSAPPAPLMNQTDEHWRFA